MVRDMVTNVPAAELGPHVTANAIAPGYIRTELNVPLQQNKDFNAMLEGRTAVSRWGKPEDLRGALLLLASDAGSYITGTAINLAEQIEGLEGRQLRLRVVTIEPGGVAAVHSHKGRPGVAYIAQGTVTEYREGGSAKDYGVGDVIVEDKDTVHWSENKGSGPAIVVAVDVFKP